VVKGVEHAVRYVDRTSLKSTEPPRQTGLMVLAVCLLLAVFIIIRVVNEDFSTEFGWFLLTACAVVILIAGYIAFIVPGHYQLTVRFKNGETIDITTRYANHASEMQAAIHDALDQLDYHDTDQARPTVVLASLEPTRLTPVGGPEPAVVTIDDNTMRDLGIGPYDINELDEAEADDVDEAGDDSDARPKLR